MTDKLQELTERLYNEGLSKGKSEGEAILKEAGARAESIISEAQSKAAAIIEEAEKKAADIRAKAESDIKMASSQTIQETKIETENLLLNSTVGDKASQTMKNPEFLKEIILTVVRNFSTEGKADINLILPETMKADLEKWLSSELAAKIDGGINASFSRKISGGFTIGPKDGSWFINFSDESFRSLFTEYLRPVTKKLLFGE